MGTLNQFLVEKRVALRAIQAAGAAKVDLTTQFLATGRIAGGTGVREIRIRDFQLVTDVVETFAGFNLGPAAPELMLGALASCLMHTGLTVAADQEFSLKSMSVEVWGQMNPMAQTPGFEHIPIATHNLGYHLHVDSPETPERIALLKLLIERRCALLNLIKDAQPISGDIQQTTTRVA